MATQDTVTQLIAAIRRVRRVVPGADRVPVSAHDYETSGKPLIAWDDPVAKAALVDALVRDALTCSSHSTRLQPIPTPPPPSACWPSSPAKTLNKTTDGTWKIAQRVAPDRMISTVDPKARHMRKSHAEYRDGYKAHIAIEPETGLVTKAILTKANVVDGRCASALVADEDPGLMVLGDTAYASGETLATLAAAEHTTAIKPWPSKAAVPGGFERAISSSITTPAPPPARPGAPSRSPPISMLSSPRTVVGAHSARAAPLPTGAGNSNSLRTTKSWSRSGRRGAEVISKGIIDDSAVVERAIAWLVADAHGRVRFRGVERNQLGLSLRVAALNLRRLINLGLIHNGAWTLSIT